MWYKRVQLQVGKRILSVHGEQRQHRTDRPRQRLSTNVPTPIKTTSWTRPAAIAMIAAGFVFVSWRLMRPWLAPATTAVGAPTVSAQEHQARMMSRWSKLEFAPLTPLTADGPSEAARHLSDVVVGNPQVVATHKRDFAAAVAKGLLIRALDPAACSAAMAADSATRWAMPADNEWATLTAWFEYSTGQAPLADSGESLFREFLAADYERKGFRFADAALTTAGTRMFLYTVRTREQIILECDRLLGAEREQWMRGNNARAVGFRVPKTSLDEVLARDGIATIGSSWVLVKSKEGEPFLFECDWFFDPATNMWATDSVSRRGWNGRVFR